MDCCLVGFGGWIGCLVGGALTSLELSACFLFICLLQCSGQPSLASCMWIVENEGDDNWVARYFWIPLSMPILSYLPIHVHLSSTTTSTTAVDEKAKKGHRRASKRIPPCFVLASTHNQTKPFSKHTLKIHFFWFLLQIPHSFFLAFLGLSILVIYLDFFRDTAWRMVTWLLWREKGSIG